MTPLAAIIAARIRAMEEMGLITGYRANATWWDEKWLFGETNMADPEADWDDEPDLYRVGKAAAGRLLDGREWNDMPGALNHG